MADDRFVTEAELEEAKRIRQEEWEKVRKPEEPEEAPEPDTDNRPLFERLREQKEKAEMDKAEEKRFKHLVRGLDDEEMGFLDMVDNLKEKQLRERRNEEKELLKEIEEAANKDNLEASLPSVSAVLNPVIKKASTPKANKQALLISGAVKRKSDSAEGTAAIEPSSCNTSTAHAHQPHTKKVCKVIGVRPSATTKVGVLPGLAEYSSSDSDDSDSSNDSSNDGDEQKRGSIDEKGKCCAVHDKNDKKKEICATSKK